MSFKLKKKSPVLVQNFFCEPGRIRTYGRLLRREVLYPAELRAHNIWLSKDIKQKIVGVAGFEPATSSSQTRRDNRATLHPEIFFCDSL